MFKYSYKSTADTNIDMKLYYCGNESCKPNHFWGPALKDHYKIHFIHSGKGIYKVGGKEYKLTKGQGFLICPHNISYYKADGEDPWMYSWVAFNGLNAELYLSRANLSLENPIFKYERDDKIIKCFDEMFKCSEFKDSQDIKLLGLLYNFLALIVEVNQIKTKGENIAKMKDIYIKKTIEFIENNYSRKISLPEISEGVGLSSKYLSKLFKETLNLSLQDFLIQYRINKACELIKKPNLSLSEISLSVGYADLFQFSKMFKKLKGSSPNTFRNR